MFLTTTLRQIALDQYALTGEGSEGIDALDTHLVARGALHAMIDEVMQGRGESREAAIEYLSLMLTEAAQTYARAVQASDDPTEVYQLGAVVLRHSLVEMQEMLNDYQCGVSIPIDSIEDIAEAFELQAEELDSPAEEFTMLEQTYGCLHQGIIGVMLDSAEDNQNDRRRERWEELKVKMFGAAKDTIKIALGATAAIMAVRWLDKR